MICLVTALAFDDVAEAKTTNDLTMPYIPLGLLSLTAVLEEQDFPVEIVDLNRLFEEVRLRGEGDFCEAAAHTLADYPTNLFGFSSICSSYPLTIRIAQLLRERRPEVTIIFGGPQASAVHQETLAAFPWVDIIVRGEAEITLLELVDRLRNGHPLEDLAGISYRVGDEIRINPPAPLIADLDALPIPAYHRYPTERFRQISIDAGRGCPFACTFCSTNDFFRRRYRLKSPTRLLAEMCLLNEKYGVTTFSLNHDMFTVDKKKVRAFCETFRASGFTHLKWGCSARIDCVDADLLAEMAEAGCVRLFFGVETGSANMQREIKKKLKIEEILPIVREACQLGMRTTTSFITGFPTETPADLCDTLHLLMEIIRLEHTVPQLHLLAPLPGTPLHQEWKNDLAFNGVYSDMSFLGWDREGENLRLILDHPDIFPSFYYTPTRHLDRKYLGDIRDFFVATTSRFRWLTLMLYEKSENYLRLFEAWRSWPSHHRSNSADHAEPYYFSPHFPKDFLDFVEDYCKAWEPHTFSFVKSLLAYEHAILAVEEVERAEKSSREGQGECQAELTLDARPLLCNNVVVQTFPFNYIEIIHALQTHRPLDLIPATRTDIIFRRSANGKVETIKVPPVTVRLLQLCDGRSTVADIIRTFQQREGTPERSKIETLCFSGLEALQKRGLISYRTALEKPSLLDKYSQSHRTVLSERS